MTVANPAVSPLSPDADGLFLVGQMLTPDEVEGLDDAYGKSKVLGLQ